MRPKSYDRIPHRHFLQPQGEMVRGNFARINRTWILAEAASTFAPLAADHVLRESLTQKHRRRMCGNAVSTGLGSRHPILRVSEVH
jgi:hypothetical protein